MVAGWNRVEGVVFDVRSVGEADVHTVVYYRPADAGSDGLVERWTQIKETGREVAFEQGQVVDTCFKGDKVEVAFPEDPGREVVYKDEIRSYEMGKDYHARNENDDELKPGGRKVLYGSGRLGDTAIHLVCGHGGQG